MPRRGTLLLTTLIGMTLAIAGASTGGAQVITAGIDAWETPAGATHQDFSDNPLPADFFGPGSLPWAGTIDLEGHVVDSTQPADTLIERLASATVVCGGPGVYVPIRMTYLSLKSTAPIIVEYRQAYSELWDVSATASSAQNEGYAMFKKTCTAGGTFTSVLPVQPILTFRRQGDGMTVTYAGEEIVFQSEPIGWVYAADTPTDSGAIPAGTMFDTDGDGVAEVELATSNIKVGVDMTQCSCTMPPAGYYVREINDEQARLARHGVRPPYWAQQ